MYRSNLPDGVVIPDMLVSIVEDGKLDDQAKATIEKWAVVTKDASSFLKGYWQKRIASNITLCERYYIPECAKLFSYVRVVMERTWK